jgi:hypothetical protein
MSKITYGAQMKCKKLESFFCTKVEDVEEI